MVVGQTLFKLDGNDYNSPQFPRGGLAAMFALDVTHLNAHGFAPRVEHRNTEDTTWATAGSFGPISSVGQYQIDVSGLKELVRLVYRFTAITSASGAVHFLAQDPSWRPY